MRASPENTVGMPMTIPENVESPPRDFAYSLDDETMMKNEIYNLNEVIYFHCDSPYVPEGVGLS